MAPTEPLVVENLGKLFRTASGTGPAGGVHDTSFTLQPGTFFTLLGPSGCGKTTTLRAVAGLETPDRGRIALGDRVFFDAAKGINVPLNHRNIGMVFQSYAIWPHMTVFENVAFPLRVARGTSYDRDTIKRMVDKALDTVSLGGFGSRPATRLSGGQQQRVALARAIVRQPRLLLLDEPLSNLDAALREDMRTELKRLQAQIGVTTVYVTHDQAEALDMSDRIAVMNAGRVVQMGAPRDIYFRPANAFVAGFVGATNLLPATAAEATVANTTAPATLATGHTLHCLFPRAAAPAARLAVSIRPECLTLSPPGTPTPPDTNRLDGVVATTGFLGNMNRYGIRVGDTVLHANTAPDTLFDPGAPVALHVTHANTTALPEDAP